MSDMTIQYRGFTPTDLQRTILNMMMTTIAEEVPTSSVLRATFIREGVEFRGLLHVSSRAFDADVVATAHSPSVTAARLRDRLRRKLSRLKTNARVHAPTPPEPMYDHAG
mgnify:FL=1